MARVNIVQKTTLLKNKRLDADFFQKRYIELDKKIVGAIPIQRSASTVDLQSNGAFRVIFNILNDNQPKEVPYIRSGNVGDFFINKEQLHSISKRAHSKLLKTHTEVGDILMARKGKIGGATLITKDDIGYNSNDNVTNIRLKKNDFLPAYFVAFWNSKYGLQQVERFATGNVQPWLSMKQIRMLRTVKLSQSYQKEISDIVLEAYAKDKKSKTLKQQAGKLLEKELGLDNITFDNPKSYTASFSEVINNNRADSDFYQVKFKQLENHISTLKTTALASICSFQKGYEVGTKLYTDEGPTFIRVSNLTVNGFTFGNSDKYISKSTYDTFKAHKPNIGDILLTKDGTIGTCYLVDEEVEGIVSSGIMNLTLNDTSIPKEYLALVINSQICQMQADRDCSGALITHWKPEQIRKMKIPILSSETMEHLADLIKRSKAARKESKQLLEQAKNRVEELIEAAAQN
mgnify:CR=1 FL=1